MTKTSYVVALLFSGGDFHKGITTAVMGGWDTDCNGATVGSIVGAICGARRAPGHWVGRLNDTLKSAVVGYDPIAISECARRSLETVRKVRGVDEENEIRACPLPTSSGNLLPFFCIHFVNLE